MIEYMGTVLYSKKLLSTWMLIKIIDSPHICGCVPSRYPARVSAFCVEWIYKALGLHTDPRVGALKAREIIVALESKHWPTGACTLPRPATAPDGITVNGSVMPVIRLHVERDTSAQTFQCCP